MLINTNYNFQSFVIQRDWIPSGDNGYFYVQINGENVDLVIQIMSCYVFQETELSDS